MKKLLALTLAVALCLGLGAPALADGPDGPPDVAYYVDGAVVPALTQEEIDSGNFLTIDVQELVDGDIMPISDELPVDMDWDALLSQLQEAPMLRLWVNGVASEVTVSAENGVSYADADDLRAILGESAVAADAAGNVAVRAAAQAAGWDVAWYDYGWAQEVQLWNEAAFLAEIEPQLAGFQALYDMAMDMSRAQIYTETAQRTTETMDLTLTRFSTLDGNKTYTARIQAEVLAQKGVVDITLTFNVADFLKMFTPQELAALTSEADFSLSSLTTLLTGGKAELVLDLNEGAIAFNAPILGLVDENLSGWQVIHIPELQNFLDQALQPSFGHLMFETMTAQAPWSGAASARMSTDQAIAIIAAMMGPDKLTVDPDGAFRWSLTTAQVNGLLYDVMASALPGFAETVDREGFSFFKKCDLSASMDKSGKVSANMAMRLDADGIAAFALNAAPYADASDALTSVGMRILLSLLDMELTVTETGNVNSSVNETMRLHWNNQGTLELKAQSRVKSSSDSPRQVADIEREWVKAPLTFPGMDLGVIGGADGPTAISVTP